jgi:hypothetical protein
VRDGTPCLSCFPLDVLAKGDRRHAQMFAGAAPFAEALRSPAKA